MMISQSRFYKTSVVTNTCVSLNYSQFNDRTQNVRNEKFGT